MTKEEKVKDLERKIFKVKKDVDYYNAMQLALKLVLNGSYGAFATPYFILFNESVAGTITAEGRAVTKVMSKDNQDYWYNLWHLDTEFHKKMGFKDVEQISNQDEVSIYADTDSVFVGFDAALQSCDWKDRVFNETVLNKVPHPFAIIGDMDISFDNSNYIAQYNVEDVIEKESIDNKIKVLLIDGLHVKNYKLNKILEDFKGKIMYNWGRELDCIHGMDRFKIADYFKEKLEEHAASYGVDNKEDFELERVDESIINVAKKKYIQHVAWEDGLEYDRFKYVFPKGVELVRSSTPLFARDKIPAIVRYLFENPKSFNIKELLKRIKQLRKEFELADVEEVSGQTSCNKYEIMVINDKDKLEFQSGTHFAVKAAAFYNLVLANSAFQDKYEYVRSGDKIKYFYTTDDRNPIFAFLRGYYPIEFAPPVDYDTHFQKMILSPINSIIEPLGMPEISKRLSVVMDIFS